MSWGASGIGSEGHFLGVWCQGREEREQRALPSPQGTCPEAGVCCRLEEGLHRARCLPTSPPVLPLLSKGKGRGWERREGPWTRELGVQSECGNEWGREGMNGKCVNESRVLGKSLIEKLHPAKGEVCPTPKEQTRSSALC